MTKTTKQSGTTQRGRHLPSITYTLTHQADGRVMVLMSDIGHRRVSVYRGRTAEDLGKPQIQIFEDRESHRDYVETRLNAAEEAGFVAI
jgi:hypothetical protein